MKLQGVFDLANAKCIRQRYHETEMSKNPLMGLRKMARIIIGENVQEGYHNSREDTETVWKIYKEIESDWYEKEIKQWLPTTRTDTNPIEIEVNDENNQEQISEQTITEQTIPRTDANPEIQNSLRPDQNRRINIDEVGTGLQNLLGLQLELEGLTVNLAQIQATVTFTTETGRSFYITYHY